MTHALCCRQIKKHPCWVDSLKCLQTKEGKNLTFRLLYFTLYPKEYLKFQSQKEGVKFNEIKN